jgi:hypothetical protein
LKVRSENKKAMKAFATKGKKSKDGQGKDAAGWYAVTSS